MTEQGHSAMTTPSDTAPYPAFLQDPDRAERFMQILDEELALRGLPVPAAERDLPASQPRRCRSS